MESQQTAPVAPDTSSPLPLSASPGVPAASEPNTFSAEKKPGKMGLLIGVIILLLLIVGAGGYYFYQKQLQQSIASNDQAPSVVVQSKPTMQESASPSPTASTSASLDQQEQTIDNNLSSLNSDLNSVDQSVNDQPDNFTN